MLRFITFEGGDGCGKTTQLRALQRYLESQGRSCVVTREPGGTSLGSLIRQVLLEGGKEPIAPAAELFLYLADRAEHVRQVILPALKDNKIVLCDRYTDSTLAYQGYGRGIEMDLLRRLNSVADDGVQPDLTLLLDCPVELGLARTADRQLAMGAGCGREDRFEQEKLEFHEKVRAGFLELARSEPRRFRVLDAARPVAEVTREIRCIVDRELA
jgi:dTMP kinase